MLEFQTKETDLVDRHDHHTGQNKVIYYHTYLQSLALFVEYTQVAEIRRMKIPLNLEWARMFLPSKLSRVRNSWCTNMHFANTKQQNTTKRQARILAAIIAHLPGASRP